MGFAAHYRSTDRLNPAGVQDLGIRTQRIWLTTKGQRLLQ